MPAPAFMSLAMPPRQRHRPPHRAGLLGALGVSLLLAACASAPVAPPAPAGAAALPDARAVARWTASGKAGIRFLGQSVSVTYRWQRQAGDYDAEAAGTLNQGHTTVSSRAGHVVLENAWLGRHESDDAEGLTAALTGIALPLASLNAWLTGWPADPATPVRALTEADGVREFDERGWQIRVAEEQVQAGHRVPRRLTITQGGDRLVLTLAQWQPDAPL